MTRSESGHGADERRIVVVGGGYGGLAAARRLGGRLRRSGGLLGRRDVPGAPPLRPLVTLVDRHPYHLLETRLHEAVARGTDVTFPIHRALEGLPVELRLGHVERIDLGRRRVHILSDLPLPYDALIIALGSQTNFYGIPGLADHALELKDLEDVHRIRQQLARVFAAAAAERNPQRRRELLTIVIGGGGLTGVELAAELAERVPELARTHGLFLRDVDLILVEMGARILPTLDEAMSRRAAAELERRGVRILTGTRIVEARQGAVQLEPGGWLAVGALIWTGGVRAAELFVGDGNTRVETGPQGRLVVEPTLMLKGCPGVFAVGDIALALDPATGLPVAQAAQLALQQGEVAADNVLAWLEGRPLEIYRPRWLGELVSLGRYAAVGWAKLPWRGRLRLVGYIASLVKWASQARYQLKLRGPAGLLQLGGPAGLLRTPGGGLGEAGRRATGEGASPHEEAAGATREGPRHEHASSGR